MALNAGSSVSAGKAVTPKISPHFPNTITVQQQPAVQPAYGGYTAQPWENPMAGTSATQLGSTQSIIGQNAWNTLNTPQNAPQMGQLSWNNPLAQQARQAVAQAGQMQLEAGLNQLRQGWGQQTESERERMASRGLIGGGPENEAMRRLFQTQAQESGNYAAQVQAANMQQQNEAAMQMLGLTSQRDVANLQAVLQTSQMNLDAAGQLATLSMNRALEQGRLDDAYEARKVSTAIEMLKGTQRERELEDTSKRDIRRQDWEELKSRYDAIRILGESEEDQRAWYEIGMGDEDWGRLFGGNMPQRYKYDHPDYNPNTGTWYTQAEKRAREDQQQQSNATLWQQMLNNAGRGGGYRQGVSPMSDQWLQFLKR